MGRLLLPDAGPLFSLAAGELLEVLLNFELVISDVVKQETIDRGAGKCASFEAISLADFYSRHQQFIHIEPTQIGHLAGMSQSAMLANYPSKVCSSMRLRAQRPPYCLKTNGLFETAIRFPCRAYS